MDAIKTSILVFLNKYLNFEEYLRHAGPNATYELNLLLVFVIIVISFLAIFLMIGRYSRLTLNLQKNSQELTSGVRGKLEKLEQEVNQLKTTQIRNQEIFSDKLTKMAEVLEEIKKKELSEEIELVSQDLELIETTSKELFSEIAEPALELKEQIEVHQVQDSALASEELLPLQEKLTKTRSGLFGKLKSFFNSNPTINLADLDEIEELLVSADLGVKTSLKLIEETRRLASGSKDVSFENLISQTKTQVNQILLHQEQEEFPISPSDPNQLFVVLLIGVNGVGKTTTAAKLASKWKDAGLKVTMAAADTFRAAAVDQLLEWGKRLDIPVVQGEVNAKPATVVFSAIDQALAEKSNILIIDTAGRLHNKANLMQELEGINNVIQKKLNRNADETILVLDGATGQNALQQAKEFNQIIPLTGVVVTKLDGTPKGGIVVAIKSELNIPIRYIGVGESANDLRTFNAQEFTNAIFS